MASTQRGKRRDLQLQNNDPINFTCGDCKQVHSFDKTRGLVCINVDLQAKNESFPIKEEVL